MKPFLKQVAEAYLASEWKEMMDYCFVFPNKRSGVFFSQLSHGASFRTSVDIAPYHHYRRIDVVVFFLSRSVST